MPGKRKRKLSVDEVVEKREPFGFSILANVDERLWTNMLHRLMNGADIKKEARILAKHSGCPLAECEDFLVRSFGLSDSEFQDRMKFFGRALALDPDDERAASRLRGLELGIGSAPPRGSAGYPHEPWDPPDDR